MKAMEVGISLRLSKLGRHPDRSEAESRDPFRYGAGMDPGSAPLRGLSGMTVRWERTATIAGRAYSFTAPVIAET
jgi:hypothetical protein